MCLIIHKPEGVKFGDEWIENSFLHNHDGWGIMWAEGGSVRVEKGFKLKSLIKAIHRQQERELGIHMRAATHGNEDIHNCHPFQVTDDVWLMHNGIISIPETNKAWSDTKHFTEFCVKPILQAYPNMFGTALLEGMLEYFVGTNNKLLLMNGKGKVQIINKTHGKEEGACWLSNSYSITEWGKGYSHTHSTGWNTHWDDECEGFEYNYGGTRQKKKGCTSLVPVNNNRNTSSTDPSRDLHFCRMCQVLVDAPVDAWIWEVGKGYICPECQGDLKDLRDRQIEFGSDLSVEELKALSFEEIKEYVETFPDSIAWLISNLD